MTTVGGEPVFRVRGVEPDEAEPSLAPVFAAQVRRWGAPLYPYLCLARRPTIFRAVAGMGPGIDASGLVSGTLKVLLNRRVAALNGCEF